jgi:hypothetical protein
MPRLFSSEGKEAIRNFFELRPNPDSLQILKEAERDLRAENPEVS